jgi:hypothetical protein
MAQTLDASRVIPVYVYGQADIIALFALRNVTQGDTLDLSTIGQNASFQVVKRAVILGVSDFVEIAANFTGTLITMPAGLANSSAYLLAWGC